MARDRKAHSLSLGKISKPELLWIKFKPKERDRVKAFVLIGSWTVTVILFGVVMLYG